MKKILKLKHWHIFTLVFGLQFIYQFIMIFNPEEISIFLKFQPIVILISATAFFSWLWISAINLNKRLDEKLIKNILYFKISFIYVISYLFIISTYLLLMGTPNNAVILFHIPAIIFLFYCILFVSKTLKTLELKKDVHVSDFLGDFLLLFFFPLGIWIIQPRINSFFIDSPSAQN